MDATEIKQALEEVFDGALVYHGFTDYMRDYEMYLYPLGGSRCLRYLFRHCVIANVETALRPDIWSRSLDERLIEAQRS